ncbi:MAG: hypothetical protein QOF49_1652 [Chloroflexota bacterium]|jgi:hypothetical protein|nr:hypothetical protein [Chloroflexota bacterium]
MTEPRSPDQAAETATGASAAYEPADRLPATRIGPVAGTAEGPLPVARRGRSSARWILALVGVLVVAIATALIVSLAGARPAASSAIGWMPATTTSYGEVRLDLPGDQRPKLAAFLAAFPGFKDQSQIEPKLNDVLDRIVRAASKDKQTWTTDIKPWFAGQIAVGMGSASGQGANPGASAGPGAASHPLGLGVVESGLVVVTITDRAKAIDWLTRTSDGAPLSRTTYGNADLFTVGSGGPQGAIAVTDKAMIAGVATAVKAAVDSNGAGTLAQNADIKAALATVDKDNVVLGIVRTRAQLEAMTALMAAAPGAPLAGTRIDDTVLAMVPAWTATTARFENDAIVATTAGPGWPIGVDTANRTSQVLGHVPAKTIAYFEAHDLGPTLTALVAKFRALPETKPAFDQADQVLGLLGGLDAVVGWWGDTAVVVTPVADGTIGAGLVIKPRDAAAAERLATTVGTFLALGGNSVGVTTRTEDHNGTKVTILDASGVPGIATGDLPPGYRAELAWATNADVTVIGYGAGFVNAVLDAGPGASLADDARFKALLDRVGAENMSAGYLDVAGIRTLIEPLAQHASDPGAWTTYSTEIKPYLDHIDAVIQAVRKDQGLDLGKGALTVR